jgi:dolichol-phosphate mannosyltransferase
MIYILLPAYNEELALRPLVDRIHRTMHRHGYAYRIVVVNDGSRDGTAEILKELQQTHPIDVVTHVYNRGLGETARDGFEYIADIASPTDVIVRMDCDDTHHPRYIVKMIEKLNQGYEVVITSRYQPGARVHGLDWYRRTISRIANLMFKCAFPIKGVWEYTCGYRAYRASIIQDALAIFGNKFIDLKGLGFTGTLEKLVKLRMLGARIVEIPFILRYDRKLGASKVVTSITTLGCFVLMIKHQRWWGAEGQRWKLACAERKARVNGGPARRDLHAVRSFWEENPLYSGESQHEPGERKFFEAHERMTISEHSGSVDPIFTTDVKPGRHVLDVGCGIGFWIQQFGNSGAQLSACDLTERAVAISRRRLELFGLNADVRVGNAEDLPYSDASFDHVNCHGVIHHTPDTEKCIQEFHRVLKPDGTLCFSVYYRPLFLRSRMLFRLVTLLTRPLILMRGRGREGMMAAQSPDEIVRMYDGVANPIGKAYTRSELLAMLGDRFEVLEQRRIGFPRRVFPIPVTDGIHRLLGRLFGLMIVMRCRKKSAMPAKPAAIAQEAAPAAAPTRQLQEPAKA